MAALVIIPDRRETSDTPWTPFREHKLRFPQQRSQSYQRFSLSLRPAVGQNTSVAGGLCKLASVTGTGFSLPLLSSLALPASKWSGQCTASIPESERV